MQDHFKKHGVFSWNELMTTDLEAAKKFYGELFGWEFQEAPMPNGDTYVMAKNGETLLAGMFRKNHEVPAEVPPHWGSYVTVDDVDAAADKAQKLGGVLAFPLTDIPGTGRICMIQDPQGACIHLIAYEPMDD